MKIPLKAAARDMNSVRGRKNESIQLSAPSARTQTNTERKLLFF